MVHLYENALMASENVVNFKRLRACCVNYQLSDLSV
jgi:hypothetical protein